MTLMQAADGEDAEYVDLAETITEYATDTSAALQHLWRRIAFSVAINNTDDHRRNHGFLRRPTGWALSPVFDLNPNPDTGEARTTSIGGTARGPEQLTALLDHSGTFGLTALRCRQILHEVFAATADWRRRAVSNGVPAGHLAQFEGAFEQHRAAVDQLT